MTTPCNWPLEGNRADPGKIPMENTKQNSGDRVPPFDIEVPRDQRGEGTSSSDVCTGCLGDPPGCLPVARRVPKVDGKLFEQLVRTLQEISLMTLHRKIVNKPARTCMSSARNKKVQEAMKVSRDCTAYHNPLKG